MNIEDKKVAFTLAEVLITLGIIGIVAALTLPAVIGKIKHKQLETRFKKTYSVLSQITMELPMQFGACNSDVRTHYQLNDFVLSKLNNPKLSTVSYDSFNTYNLKPTAAVMHNNCFSETNTSYLTSDGTAIAFCLNWTQGNMISIDINGPQNKPNAFGHDLFFFGIDKETCKLYPFTAQWRTCTAEDTGCAGGGGSNFDGFGYKWTAGNCSKSSNAIENGFACTQKAISNTCPDDNSKSYWDCLP